MRTSRDQGALDTSILYQSRKAQKCYLAMAAMRPATPAVGHAVGSHSPSGAYVPAVSPYLPQKLTRPLVTKDSGTLRTVKDARAYMLARSKQRETRAQWQRAAELLLDGATVGDFSKVVALFYDAKLDVAAMT